MAKRFFIGLANAAVSGAVAGVAGGYVYHGSAKQIAASIGLSAAVSAGKWLYQHPLPGADAETK